MVTIQIGSLAQHEANQQDDTQPPLRQQRRLSKPNASGKSIVSSGVAPTFSIRRKALPKNSIFSPYNQDAQSHEASRSSLFATPAGKAGDDTPNKSSRVAHLINKIEGNIPTASTSQLSLSKPPNSRTSTFNSDRPPTLYKAGTTNFASRERLGLGTNPSSVSPSSSLDRLSDNPAPPPRRTATLSTPGIATRKSGDLQSTIQNISEEAPVSTSDHTQVSPVEDSHDSDSIWSPPPQIKRAETPLDLEQTHLGGLTLGSLHVVNGRASPAFSEMSKRLRSQLEPRVRRDISSIYPDSEKDSEKDKWEDDNVPSSPPSEHNSLLKTPTKDNRKFSFEAGSEAQLSAITKDDAASTTASSRQDKTSQMAEEYMAEMPASPYQGSPASSKGSVKHHKHMANSARSFVDETSLLTEDRPETAASYYSARPDALHEDRFSSAVEIQPPPSPSRATEETLSVISERRPRLSDRSNTAISDSGYSSNTSLGIHTIGMPYPASDIQDQGETTPKASARSRFGFALTQSRSNNAKGVIVNSLPIKPVYGLVERVATPEKSSSRAFPPSSFKPRDKEAFSQPTTPEKASKTRKKLQKFRRKSMTETSKEIVVQKKASMSTFHGVPEINATARSNLARRVEGLPELEKTFKTHQHTGLQGSTSALHLPMIGDAHREIRFPSPAPEKNSKRVRSWSRPRMPSRPKSWFGWGKDETKDNRKQQSSYESEDIKATLDSFGTVIDVLGSNPYDIATSSKPGSIREDFSRRNTSPHSISFNAGRPKSMMDDDTAVKISKMRSKFAADKDARGVQRHSFDDRGGIPGRYLLSTSVTEDAPPMPPVPNREELERRFSHQVNRPASFSIRSDERDIETQQDDEQQSSPANAPPPPPHSPRPQFVHYDHDVHEHESEAPPPPPCHSPRPRDISPYSFSRTGSNVGSVRSMNEDDQWAAQSRAWRARRMSAGEALRQSGGTDGSSRSSMQHAVEHTQEPLYPDIPHRANTWQEPTRYYDDGYDHSFEDLSHEMYQPDGMFNDFHQSGMVAHPGSNPRYWEHKALSHHGMYGSYDHPDYNYNPRWQQYAKHRDWEPSYEARSHSRPHSRGRPLPNQPAQLGFSPQSGRYYENVSPSRIDSHSRHSRSPHGQRMPSRPHSRANSSHSMAVSLAEELHPELPTRRSPAPDFGRYSGGLEFGYEGRARGFGGSAGTRSVSGKADAHRKSVADGQTYGVDFSDIPAMTVSVGAVPNGKMRYGAWYDGEGRRHDG